MWFLENWNQSAYNFLPQANAATNLTNRFPFSKWKVLGILLENGTNTPLQELLWTWQLDIRSYTWSVNMYITNTVKQTWKVNELYGTMENMAISQKYDKPQKDCPTWYIPVPWNMDFWQPAFCVAKYEMSYEWLTQTDNSWDWNTYSYLDNIATRPTLWKIVSQQWNSPIAEITQLEAILECKAIWPWYHLITNNEWMSIARNIEQQWINWSSWQVWSWYIYKWCLWNISTNSPLSNIWGTITWDTSCVWEKNKLTLSNSEQIWDLAWNAWELVNKANTLDWYGYNLWTTQILSASPLDNWDSDWIYSRLDMDKYWSKYNYWMGKWMWSVHYWSWVINNVFIRGWSGNNGSVVGIFTLNIVWIGARTDRRGGFRCSK